MNSGKKKMFGLTLPYPCPFFVQADLANAVLSSKVSQITRTPCINMQLLTVFSLPFICIKAICSVYLFINLKGRNCSVNFLCIGQITLPAKMHILCC